MSYDVDVGDKWFNYTSNMRQLFIDYGAYPLDWAGMTGAAVAEQITEALVKIMNEGATHLDSYGASNGWGDWRSAMNFLLDVRDSCRANPDAIVQASA